MFRAGHPAASSAPRTPIVKTFVPTRWQFVLVRTLAEASTLLNLVLRSKLKFSTAADPGGILIYTILQAYPASFFHVPTVGFTTFEYPYNIGLYVGYVIWVLR
eukprot:SAG11_NODE_584_length_8351_cov_159.783568_1_plen_103_part_00